VSAIIGFYQQQINIRASEARRIEKNAFGNVCVCVCVCVFQFEGGFSTHIKYYAHATLWWELWPVDRWHALIKLSRSIKLRDMEMTRHFSSNIREIE
jgi:hypothetical protein